MRFTIKTTRKKNVLALHLLICNGENKPCVAVTQSIMQKLNYGDSLKDKVL